ncbi:DUF4240 domain-containing protein [Nakamurella lactea]|uniref:DUF4240 domain-containing protein n=1 Tax=Nakamurella lactea TaxID=459515 RepID=UPI000428DD0C|nr:DUF4240 domain-containing protein [Nakamurella lactea]
MTDEEFWELIAGLHGRAEPEGVAVLTENLTQGDTERIESFAEHLASALHAIDSRDRMAQPIRDTADGPESPAFPLSKEVFLYARCAVVASGRQVWQKVLQDPSAMSDTWDLGAEELLYVAPVAFEHKTGSDWTFRTSVGYETGSNEAGWR